MRALLTIVTILSVSMLYGQGKETRTTGQFLDIDIQGPFKVKLIKGDVGKLKIDSEAIPLDEIITDVRGKQLVVKLKSRVYLKEKYYDADYIQLEISYDKIEEIEVSMGCQLAMSDAITQDYLRVESTMGAELELDIKVEELISKVSMGGIVNARGTAEYAEIVASMGGEFHGTDLQSEKTDVRSGMGGYVSIYSSERLKGSASMGGVIRYTGDPDRKNTSTVLGGEIYRKKDGN